MLILSLLAFIAISAYVDLFLVGKKAITTKAATIATVFWVLVAGVFGGILYFTQGAQVASTFGTVYLVEKMLSMDNLFVFMLIFSYFGIKDKDKHRILTYGIIGAFVFRAIFIFGGLEVINQMHVLVYALGALLVYLGIKTALSNEDEADDVSESLAIRISAKFGLSKIVTCIIAIEIADIIFAIDSVPAAFAFTQDAQTIFMANVCAIMGLRALFFLVDSLAKKLVYLNIGLGIILAFIGAKVFTPLIGLEISTTLSLEIVALVLLTTTLLSLRRVRLDYDSL